MDFIQGQTHNRSCEVRFPRPLYFPVEHPGTDIATETSSKEVAMPHHQLSINHEQTKSEKIWTF